MGETDMERVREGVFRLVGVATGLDTELSLRRVNVLEGGDESLMDYLGMLEVAHQNFLEIILCGHRFRKMEENPVKSTDAYYGVPKLYIDMFQELLENTQQYT
jgi:hypothetical protein